MVVRSNRNKAVNLEIMSQTVGVDWMEYVKAKLLSVVGDDFLWVLVWSLEAQVALRPLLMQTLNWIICCWSTVHCCLDGRGKSLGNGKNLTVAAHPFWFLFLLFWCVWFYPCFWFILQNGPHNCSLKFNLPTYRIEEKSPMKKGGDFRRS